jgi:cytochrome c oxidase assembly factor CtaG
LQPLSPAAIPTLGERSRACKDGGVLGAAPPPFEPSSVVLAWRLDPATLLPIAAAASLYGVALRRLSREGHPFPRWRSAAFFAGVGVLVLALASPVEAYAHASFTVHMLQHLLLVLVAAPLMALGAPISLALRAISSVARRRALARALRGRAASALARPVVGWLLFVLVPFGVHLTSLFDAALRSGPIHFLEHAVWLGSALVFWWPIVGSDPTPHPVSYPARLLSLTLAMPAQSFLALALLHADRALYPAYSGLPAPWGPAALSDQRGGAALMWLAGNLVLIAAMLAVAVAWKRHDDAAQRRAEQREDRRSPSQRDDAQATRPGEPSGAEKGRPSASQASMPPSRL